MNSNRKSLTITEVDNGFVLTWSDPSLERNDSLSQQWPMPPRPKTSGTIIFSETKKLVAHVKQFVGGNA